MDFQLQRKKNLPTLTASIKKTIMSIIIWLDYSIHSFSFFYGNIQAGRLDLQLEKKTANINNCHKQNDHIGHYVT